MPPKPTPSREELYNLHIVQKIPITPLGRKYKVCSHTIKRWLKNYEIEYRNYDHKKRLPTKDELIAFHLDKKMNFVKLAKHLNISEPTLDKLFKEHEVEKTYYRTTIEPPSEEELCRLHVDQKLSIEAMSKKIGVCPSTIKKWFKHYGVKRYFYEYKRTTPVTSKRRISKEKLIALHFNERKSLQQIADDLGVTRNLILLSFKEHNLKPNVYRRNKHPIPSKDIFEKLHLDEKLSHSKIAQKFGVSGHVVKRWNKELEVEQKFYSGGEYRSSAEKEIADFLAENGFTVECNSRNILPRHKELDIFIPLGRLAIEYCGLYWHDEIRKGKKSHIQKLEECESRDVSLITIFEDEWSRKKEIVKSILLAKLNKFDRIVAARKCELSLEKDVSNFLDENHLQGRGAKPLLGVSLSFEGEIVGAMTFAKHHRGNDGISLSRLCFKRGVMIQGGAERMFKESLKHLSGPVVTWSDRRWSRGRIYQKLGFQRDAVLPEDYSYHNNKGIRKSKQSMKKSKTGCPKEIKERDWCSKMGWTRIFDCGKVKWVYLGMKS